MTQKSKQTIYVFSFTFLGVLFGFSMHMWVELWYINKLLLNFEQYSMGYTWADLFYAHKILVPTLLILFGALGFWAGEYWWKQIYVLNRRWWKK